MERATDGVLVDLHRCDAYWPADLPGPNYPGTRCDLEDRHVPAQHRARVAGSDVVVTW